MKDSIRIDAGGGNPIGMMDHGLDLDRGLDHAPVPGAPTDS